MQKHSEEFKISTNQSASRIVGYGKKLIEISPNEKSQGEKANYSVKATGKETKNIFFFRLFNFTNN